MYREYLKAKMRASVRVASTVDMQQECHLPHGAPSRLLKTPCVTLTIDKANEIFVELFPLWKNINKLMKLRTTYFDVEYIYGFV